jgi:hypothetical protein
MCLRLAFDSLPCFCLDFPRKLKAKVVMIFMMGEKKDNG